jgi:outer membrane protein OmpA-like peptidoglycan-associated protein
MPGSRRSVVRFALIPIVLLGVLLPSRTRAQGPAAVETQPLPPPTGTTGGQQGGPGTQPPGSGAESAAPTGSQRSRGGDLDALARPMDVTIEDAPTTDNNSVAEAPSLPPAPGDSAVSDLVGPPSESPQAHSWTLPSLTGALGLLHASTAQVGPLHQLRLGLRAEYFGADNFLIAGDTNRRLAGGLTAGFTLFRNIEIFGAILNSSNRNQRLRDPTDRDPELIKTFGDVVLGGKWILPLSPAATLGVEVGVKFLSGVSNLAVSPSSTSWWLGPLFTYDLARARGIPLRLHVGGSFYADNSSNLYGLSGVTRETKEVAMFAYGISPSRLRFSLAVDAPLEKLIPGVPILPFIEYHAAYVTADADKDFRDYMPPDCGSAENGKMPCADNRDYQSLTLGVRAAVYRGLTAELGVDLRIRSPGFPYGPPVPPFNLVFGVSYPLDIDSLTRPVVITKVVEKPIRTATEGTVAGMVRNARGGAPVAGAIVGVVGGKRLRAASDPDGGFTLRGVPPGSVQLEVTAPNFESATAPATVNVGGGMPVEISVALLPSPSVGKVHGRVTNPAGKGIEATVRFAGEAIQETRSDGTGAYGVSLPAGGYQVRADAPGMAPKDAQVDVPPGQDKQIDFVLVGLLANPNVALGGERVKLKQPIRFVGASARLLPATEKLLDGVADLLQAHAEIKRLRIVAHWDGSLPKPGGTALTQSQAEAVRTYLLGRGIADARLVPMGAGASKPLVPNLNAANRARNRRVELLIDASN